LNFYFIQFITGLASACSLFLVASGLSIIFGVTRIVNFAHGAFYMLGAYVAYTSIDRLGATIGFWPAALIACFFVAGIGALIEMTLLRRIYEAPELFQLLATFGVTLMVEDLVLIIWGPDELLGPRAPGFKGAVHLFGRLFPTYDLLLIALAPIVLGALWVLFRRTRWGVLVRAATLDREMSSALGVDPRGLFTSVFALGVFLAALGGALALPREAANHTMDLQVISEALVVVVIGGLGSVIGTFVAAILVSELNAFGILVLPGVSLGLAFVVMAIVLVAKPSGLFGAKEAPARSSGGVAPPRWRPWNVKQRAAAACVLIAAASLPLLAGDYWLAVASEVLIFVIYAASLHFFLGASGLVSFGHAAYFGLGSYGAALALKTLGCSMAPAILCGVALGLAGALLFGWFCVRNSGVYSAMLTLAFAQVVWSLAFQWTAVTGGDNGVVGVWPSAWAATPAHFFCLTFTLAVISAAALRGLLFSPFGYALRALRDNEARAGAIGLGRQNLQWAGFIISGGFAALAGALHAFLKGSVFPDNLGIGLSVDGLVMALIGGVDTVLGGVVGAVVFRTFSIWTISHTDYSRLAIGALIVALVMLFPKGIVGACLSLVSRIGSGK
jgi:branched-chain amino acid transport system permease protein